MKPTPKPCQECGTQRPFCESLCGEAVFCQSCLTDAIAGDACRAANPNDGEIVAAQIPAMVEEHKRIARRGCRIHARRGYNCHTYPVPVAAPCDPCRSAALLASAGIEWREV